MVGHERPGDRLLGDDAHFPTLRAVDGIDLEVPRGGRVRVPGAERRRADHDHRLLLGLLAPTAGTVEVLGERLPDGGERVRARSGVVLEQHGLNEGLSIRRTLEFAAAPTASIGGRRRSVERVVARLGLADRLDENPQALSRGMRQRMAVARALLGSPDLLVLDEPSNGLDAQAAAGLRPEVADLVTAGTTVFDTTHLLGEAERLRDRG